MEPEVLQQTRRVALYMGGKFLHDLNPEYITFTDIDFADMSGSYSCKLGDCLFDRSWSWQVPVFGRLYKSVFDDITNVDELYEKTKYFSTQYMACILANAEYEGFKVIIQLLDYLESKKGVKEEKPLTKGQDPFELDLTNPWWAVCPAQ